MLIQPRWPRSLRRVSNSSRHSYGSPGFKSRSKHLQPVSYSTSLTLQLNSTKNLQRLPWFPGSKSSQWPALSPYSRRQIPFIRNSKWSTNVGIRLTPLIWHQVGRRTGQGKCQEKFLMVGQMGGRRTKRDVNTSF